MKFTQFDCRGDDAHCVWRVIQFVFINICIRHNYIDSIELLADSVDCCCCCFINMPCRHLQNTHFAQLARTLSTARLSLCVYVCVCVACVCAFVCLYVLCCFYVNVSRFHSSQLILPFNRSLSFALSHTMPLLSHSVFAFTMCVCVSYSIIL